MGNRPTGLLLSDDLIFASRICGTARELGFVFRTARTTLALEALARQEVPCCVIVDLANPGLAVADLMRCLAAACNPMPRVVAYGPHVDADALRAARAAGCDPVLPRSKFVEELPGALAGWMAGPPGGYNKGEGGTDVASANFDQVWEAVRTFTPEELHRLRNFIDTLLSSPALLGKTEDQLTTQDKIDLALMKRGLLSSIPHPPTEEDIKAFREWKPVEVKGEPLSETIIRERR